MRRGPRSQVPSASGAITVTRRRSPSAGPIATRTSAPVRSSSPPTLASAALESGARAASCDAQRPDQRRSPHSANLARARHLHVAARRRFCCASLPGCRRDGSFAHRARGDADGGLGLSSARCSSGYRAVSGCCVARPRVRLDRDDEAARAAVRTAVQLLGHLRRHDRRDMPNGRLQCPVLAGACARAVDHRCRHRRGRAGRPTRVALARASVDPVDAGDDAAADGDVDPSTPLVIVDAVSDVSDCAPTRAGRPRGSCREARPGSFPVFLSARRQLLDGNVSTGAKPLMSEARTSSAVQPPAATTPSASHATTASWPRRNRGTESAPAAFPGS